MPLPSGSDTYLAETPTFKKQRKLYNRRVDANIDKSRGCVWSHDVKKAMAGLRTDSPGYAAHKDREKAIRLREEREAHARLADAQAPPVMAMVCRGWRRAMAEAGP